MSPFAALVLLSRRQTYLISLGLGPDVDFPASRAYSPSRNWTRSTLVSLVDS